MPQYHCNYSYFETDLDDSKLKVESWNYPNLERILKDINASWSKENIPLVITEETSERVKITHRYPDNIGSLAQLKLSGNLAYLLGYTSEIQEFQILRFDQNREYLAPHKPNLFLDHYNRKQLETNESLHDEKVEKLFEKLTDQLEQIYIKNKHILAKLRAENFVNKKCEKWCEPEIVDKQETENLSIEDFNKYCHNHDQNWKIRGVVKAFKDDAMTLNPKLKDPYKFFVMQLSDQTSQLNISAFDEDAELLRELAVKGAEYYVTKTDDESDITATIHGSVYKIKFELVNNNGDINV